MSDVLIISSYSDIHADAVQWHLQNQGYSISRLDLSGFPHQTTHSLFLNEFSNEEFMKSETFKVNLNQHFGAVWLRRAHAPNVDKELLEKDDFFVADKLCRAHCKAILNDLTLIESFWVNKLAASNLADAKQSQLKAASKVGFFFPKTLISNDPKHIKQFICSNLPSKTIFKDIEAVAWPELLNRPVVSRTTFIDEIQLPEDVILQAVPGIFQQEIKKQFEVRAVVMGKQAFAVKIESQMQEAGNLDWREIPFELMHNVTSFYELPSKVLEKAFMLMSELGICFGCFDFIVNENGEHVFIEVNEQGQFLWMEELVPELPLLEAFCQFLVSKCPDYKFVPKPDCVSFNNLLKDESFANYVNQPEK